MKCEILVFSCTFCTDIAVLFSSSKGDYDGAIAQYIKTIGKLEASYVIRKVKATLH